MKFEYLLFNLVVIFGPILALIFRPKLTIPKARPALFSVGISALLFIVWDMVVTGHFWMFNPKYITGIKLWTIPLEEALFFLTVPFACLFLYVNVMPKFTNKKQISNTSASIACTGLLVLCFILLYLGKYYTFSVLLLASLIGVSDIHFFKTKLITSRFMWRFMGMTSLLTLVFNFYLTSRPVVLYNPLYNLNMRILSIPIEDFIYSICLISLMLILYEYYNRKLWQEK